jgi:hypothetical protein
MTKLEPHALWHVVERSNGARIANGDSANEHEIFPIGLASGVGAYEIAISVACMCVGFVADAYAVAKACSVTSCCFPSCMAASIPCNHPELGC